MKLAIYGSGDAGKEMKEIANQINLWEEIVFIDDMVRNDIYRGTKRMPFWEFQKKFSPDITEVVISLGEPKHKIKLYNRVLSSGFRFANIIHPTALISPSAKLGKGIIIRAGVTVSTDAIIGDNVTIQEYTSIGHDAMIHSHCQFAGHVVTGGHCVIGEGTYIGLNVSIREKVEIGANTIIGMGSVVINDIPENVIAIGNPAKVIKKCNDSKVFK